MPKLKYFELISPYPIYINGIGYVKSPKLSDIFSGCGVDEYYLYLYLFTCSPSDYLGEKLYQSMPNEFKNEITQFDLYLSNKNTFNALFNAIKLFVVGNVEWDKKRNVFLINPEHISDDNTECDGYISRNNFDEFCDTLLQLLHAPREAVPVVKFKSEKQRLRYEKIQAGEKAKLKNSEKNPSLTLPNIISKVCAKHPSINYINVWDLTVYQLYDQFYQLNYLNIMEIHSMNYAAWGGDFDPESWYKKISE